MSNKQGYLLKQSRYLQNWNKRWFALDTDYTRTLYYYEDKDKKVMLGSFSITSDAVVCTVDEATHQFSLTTDGKELRLIASSVTEKREWVLAIQDIIDIQRFRNDNMEAPKITAKQRPLLTRALNTLLAVPKSFKIGTWGKMNDINSAVEIVLESTGATSLGGQDGGRMMILLYKTVRRLGMERSQVQYTPFGYYIALEGLMARVSTRIKFIEYLTRHRTIDRVKVNPPIFVIGMYNTGECFLHDMLGQHHDTEMHYTWEQLNPVPETEEESMDALEMDRKARHDNNKPRFDRIIGLGGKDIQNYHYIAYDYSEECTVPCAIELPWSPLEVPFNLFAAKEVMDLGSGNAYNLYRRYLQMLTWQSPERSNRDFTWVLKCPNHLPYLMELAQTFPNSTFVWTHRNPLDCIVSACVLFETILHMVMIPETVNRNALGKAVMEFFTESLTRGMQALDRLSNENIKVVHVKYNDLMSSPKSEVSKIIQRAGLPFTPEYENKLDKYLQSSAYNIVETFDQYKLEDFGLNEEQVTNRFIEYMTRFRLSTGLGLSSSATSNSQASLSSLNVKPESILHNESDMSNYLFSSSGRTEDIAPPRRSDTSMSVRSTEYGRESSFAEYDIYQPVATTKPKPSPQVDSSPSKTISSVQTNANRNIVSPDKSTSKSAANQSNVVIETPAKSTSDTTIVPKSNNAMTKSVVLRNCLIAVIVWNIILFGCSHFIVSGEIINICYNIVVLVCITFFYYYISY
jgi:hypothetical protein